MADPNFANRTLFHGDNLAFLRGMNTESVHLIATDPPFNKGKDFHATPDSLAAGARFHDRWSWADDVEQTWVDQIEDDWPAVHAVIEATKSIYGQDMAAFLCFMGVRLLEMHRILRKDGSIYLHIDHTAHAYVKALMDAIFGPRNFQSDITWKRTSAHNDSKRFGQVKDSLLFYSKSPEKVWNLVFVPHDVSYVSNFYRYEDERGKYRLHEIIRTASMGPRPNLAYEYKGYTPEWGWRMERKKLEALDNEDRIVWAKSGRPYRKTYLSTSGQTVSNLWVDIPNVSPKSKEGQGYPTQKPLALYERIIKASSNEGDLVLDPFCGCATTPIAAERLGRQWIGMDIWDGAIDIVHQRMEDNRQLLTDIPTIHYETTPPERTDDGMEAAPFIQVTERYAEPDGPRMSRAEMYEYLLAQHGQRCQGCERGFDDPRYLELDHNTPRSDGGLNHITNRVLLCGPCNRAKSNTYTLSGLRALNKRNGWMARD